MCTYKIILHHSEEPVFNVMNSNYGKLLFSGEPTSVKCYDAAIVAETTGFYHAYLIVPETKIIFQWTIKLMVFAYLLPNHSPLVWSPYRWNIIIISYPCLYTEISKFAENKRSRQFDKPGHTCLWKQRKTNFARLLCNFPPLLRFLILSANLKTLKYR